MTSKEEYLQALKLLSDEAQYVDWTKSIKAYHLLKDFIITKCDETVKNKDYYNLKNLRSNIRIDFTYHGQSIELELIDISNGHEVVKRFYSEKNRPFDNSLVEEIFTWLEQQNT